MSSLKRSLYCFFSSLAAYLLLFILAKKIFAKVPITRDDCDQNSVANIQSEDTYGDRAMGTMYGKGGLLRHVATVVAAISSAVATIFLVTNYYLNKPEREQNRRYQAWQIVGAMEGKKGEGGRTRALSDLLDNNVSLSGIVLDNAIIKDLQLEDAILDRASLLGGDFLHASLSNSKLIDASLQKIRLRRSRLDGASLSHSKLGGAVIVDSSLKEADLSWVSGENTTFNSSVLTDSNFSNSKLDLPSFENADISGAEFLEAILSSPNFFRATIDRTRWWDSKILDGSFLYVRGQGVRVYQSIFEGAKFERARLLGLEIIGGSFRNAVFRGAQLEGARFEGVDLAGTDFSNAVMQDTIIDDACNVEGAIFSTLNGLECSKCRIGLE